MAMPPYSQYPLYTDWEGVLCPGCHKRSTFREKSTSLGWGTCLSCHYKIDLIGVKQTIIRKDEFRRNFLKDSPERGSGYVHKYGLGYVYGLRAYKDGSIHSAKHGYIVGLFDQRWYSPRQTAKCRSRGCPGHGEVPHETGRCGINMYGPHLLPKLTQIGPYNIVTLVKGWGKTIVHVDGYRVAKAEIELIYTPRNKDLKTILNIPGFRKRETQGTTSIEKFKEATLQAQETNKKMTTIPKEESSYGHSRTKSKDNLHR